MGGKARAPLRVQDRPALAFGRFLVNPLPTYMYLPTSLRADLPTYLTGDASAELRRSRKNATHGSAHSIDCLLVPN